MSAQRGSVDLVDQLREQAQFLADRLAELDFGGVPDSFYRDWDGYVAPALARLNETLAEATVYVGAPIRSTADDIRNRYGIEP